MLDKYFDLFVALIVMLIATIISVIIFIYYRRKKYNQKNSYYDERQMVLRKEAGELSFTILLIYLLVCGTLEFMGIKWCDNGVAIFIGLILSVGIFMVASTLKDCFWGIKENRKTYFILTSILIFVSGYNCAIVIIFNDFIDKGKLTIGVFSIVRFAVALAFFIAQIIVNHRIKVEEKEDGAE